MSSKGHEQLMRLMTEHPDMPLIADVPHTPGDHDRYYVEVAGAYVQSLLDANEVSIRYDCSFGLDPRRTYWDEDDVAEEVIDWLLDRWYDQAWVHGMMYDHYTRRRGMSKDEELTKYCGYGYDLAHGVSLARMAETLAFELVRAMPWREHIIIECY